MALYKERKTRKMQTIIEEDKIEHMIKNYLVKNTFYAKHSSPIIRIKIIELKPDQGILVECNTKLEDQVILFKVYKKYMEASCSVEDSMAGDRYLLKVKAINIALETRANERVEIKGGQVMINNIRAARNTINASLFNIPTSVKVHFSQYEQKLKSLADEVSVAVFSKMDDKLSLVKKTNKILWLEDTQDLLSYMPEDLEAFIDYRDHLNTDTDKIMNEYRKEKIVSQLIVPVIYIGHDGKSIPLGYIQLISKSKKITIDTVMEIKILAFEMVDRIRESNTMLINKKQEINNMSLNGLQIRVTDEELITFLRHQKGMSFDVVIKMQQPITVSTDIIYTADFDSGELLLGVKIMGSSSRKGEMERYQGFIADKLAPKA